WPFALASDEALALRCVEVVAHIERANVQDAISAAVARLRHDRDLRRHHGAACHRSPAPTIVDGLWCIPECGSHDDLRFLAWSLVASPVISCEPPTRKGRFYRAICRAVFGANFWIARAWDHRSGPSRCEVDARRYRGRPLWAAGGGGIRRRGVGAFCRRRGLLGRGFRSVWLAPRPLLSLQLPLWPPRTLRAARSRARCAPTSRRFSLLAWRTGLRDEE